jgi:hypothetical protein
MRHVKLETPVDTQTKTADFLTGKIESVCYIRQNLHQMVNLIMRVGGSYGNAY